MKSYFAFVLLGLTLLIGGRAWAEAALTPERAAYALGEEVQLTLTADKEIKSCRYTVSLAGKTLYKQKTNDTHTVVWYVPEEPGEYQFDVQVTYRDKKKDEASCRVLVTDLTAVAEREAPYSQKDGTWKDQKYGNQSLEKAGCAIFTLSNALHALGITGEETEPSVLAEHYRTCLIEGGTSNSTLINRASRAFGFETQSALVKSEAAIRDLMQDGTVFTFSIVTGHIAFIREMSEDGEKVRVIDSAPSATLERIKKGSIYTLDETGAYREITDLAQFPDSRYYFVTGQYGGLTYWMDLSYVARRGVRIIAPKWLSVRVDDKVQAADLQVFGTTESTVLVGEEKIVLPTAELIWRRETETPQAACIISKKAAILRDSGGTQIDRVPRGTLLPLIARTEESLCVRFEDRTGYLSAEDAQVVSVPPEEYSTGVVHIKGSTTGRSNVAFRRGPADNSTQIGRWPTGTAVLILEQRDGFILAEADGMRGWLKEENVMTDEATETTEQTAAEN